MKRFNECFFKTDLPIHERIKQAFSKADNLLVSAASYPLAVLIEVAEDKPRQIETMLSNLFDESKPLRERMKTYMSEFNNIIKIMKDEGHSDWKGRENVKSFKMPMPYRFTLQCVIPKHTTYTNGKCSTPLHPLPIVRHAVMPSSDT